MPYNKEESEKDSAVWQYGHSPSALEASHTDIDESRKQMILFALGRSPIRDIRTYEGYKGDLLLEITTPSLDMLPILQEHAESLGMEVVVKIRRDIQIHEVYCIVPNDDIYAIKL